MWPLITSAIKESSAPRQTAIAWRTSEQSDFFLQSSHYDVYLTTNAARAV
jgi:hypothetical protein